MKLWIIIFKTVGYLWIFLAGLLILTGIIGVWMSEGFFGVRRLLSPFNVVNWAFTIITLAPGIGFLVISEKLKAKSDNPL